MYMSQPPYVVTDDLDLVFGALPEKGLTSITPAKLHAASNAIIGSLRARFPRVDVIEATRISDFLHDCTQRADMPVLSLTSVLNNANTGLSLQFSRSAALIQNSAGDAALTDVGLMPRMSGTACLTSQYAATARTLKARFGTTDIALADDVIFSGGTVRKITAGLKAEGIHVKKIFASVALQNAIDGLVTDGVTIEADFVYQSVHDEVCMRDFVVGAPGGGRNIILQDGTYAAAPYIQPFGNMEEWASINTIYAAQHARTCLEASATLWQGARNAKGAAVTFGDLAKPVLLCEPDEGITAKLEQMLKSGAYNGNYRYTL